MNLWKASTFVLGAAFATTLAIAVARPAHAEPQPKMQAALGLLQQAKDQLQAASADKGGHRVKAIQHTTDAIAEVKAGIEFDNKK